VNAAGHAPAEQDRTVHGFVDPRRVVQLAALALAVAAAAYLVGYPTYGRSASASSSSTTLVDADGTWVLWLLLAPVVLVAIHALWPRGRRTVAIVACTVPLYLLCVAGALTIGIFFVPAALVSGLALLAPARPTTRTRTASPPDGSPGNPLERARVAP
jgi:hypothetical protein